MTTICLQEGDDIKEKEKNKYVHKAMQLYRKSTDNLKLLKTMGSLLNNDDFH